MPYPIALGKGFYGRQWPGFVGPQFLDEIAVFTTPLEGTDRHNQIRHAIDLGTDAVEFVTSATVPAEKQWYVYAWVGYHVDATQTVNQGSLRIVDPDGSNFIHVAQMKNQKASEGVVLQRRLILPPRWALQFSQTGAIAAGSNARQRYAFVEMNAGEYVPSI